MYGSPLLGLYGHKPNPTPKRKRGRPSHASTFEEKQGDMFVKETYLARLESKFPGLAMIKRGANDA